MEKKKNSKFLQVDIFGDYFAFRRRTPAQFKEFKTPQWARNVANSISKGSYITMGKTKAGSWYIQSIKIKSEGKTLKQAEQLALKILKKLEE